MGCFPRPIAHILGAVRLLALGKPSSGIRPIVVGKVLYRLDNKTLFFNIGMHSLLICYLISLAWQLKVHVKQWCSTIFELLWIFTLSGWCHKWKWWTHLTPSHVWPSSRSFLWQEANWLYYSLLSIFLPNNFPSYLFIIPLGESYLLFFCLWAWVKVIYSHAFFYSCPFSCFVGLFCCFFFMSFPFDGKQHSHLWPCFPCLAHFWSFFFPIGFNGSSCPALEMHYLVPFWLALWFPPPHGFR